MENTQMKLKSKLFALFTEGGGITHYDVVLGSHCEANEGEYVVHQAEDDSIWVLLFEDLLHAERVANDFHEATGDTCEIKPTLIECLDYDQNIRLYRIDGSWQDYKRDEYIWKLEAQ
jgi:hypothetical protein